MMTAHTNGPLQNCRALKSPLWSIIQTQVQPTALCQDLRLTAYKYYLYITTQCWCMITIIIWMHDHVIFIRMKWSTLSNAALQSKKKKKKDSSLLHLSSYKGHARLWEGFCNVNVLKADFSKKNWWDFDNREKFGHLGPVAQK